ncbi:MAG: hypothetical protein SVR08_01570 [Spirochaetota bacterium]|nr:hypothetical protein [Spirochaetota bacterium]
MGTGHNREMDQKKMNINKSYFIILFLLILLNISACEDKKKEVLFSYYKILDKEYKKNIGRVIPITIEQSIEVDGVFTKDGLHFFFTSDRDRGNSDIYLRDLTDITTVRITNHPSKDTSPAISPNGKYLAFISQRDDPEGDIFIVRVNPKDLIGDARTSITYDSSLDDYARNITLFQDKESGTIKIMKDASPCWSPDSEWIAFSSVRDGIENIWLTDRKGQEFKQITKRGGIYPRFSPDGKHCIYISYRDKADNGDIYIINIETGEEKRITDTKSIELYPSFMGSSNEIVYTLIDKDTNRDGKIDLKDNSIIYYKDLKSQIDFPLTLYSSSSFAPKWTQISLKDKYQNVVLYSDEVGQNININIIPEYGIIPKRENPRRQFSLANRYLKEFDDVERYCFSLERVYHFFRNKKDTESVIYISRALLEAAKKYKDIGQSERSLEIQRLLGSLSEDRNDYRYITSLFLKNILSGKSGDKVVVDALDRLKDDKKKKSISPFLLEDLGDEYLRLGKLKKSAEIYRSIYKEFPKYIRTIYINYKLGNLVYHSLKKDIDQSLLAVLESNYIYLKNDTIETLIGIFNKELDRTKRLKIASGMLKRYKDRKNIPGFLEFIIGKTYLEMGELRNAKLHLKKSLDLVRKADIIFYKSNILLGSIAEKEKRFDASEKYYSTAANNYLRSWKQADFRSIVEKLIKYYEENGEREELSGDYKEAVSLYKRYVYLMTYPRLRKILNDIYNEYAPRAHVLYIDAYSELTRDDFDKLTLLEKEYLKRLPISRMDFDKAQIYGLGYLYSKMAFALQQKKISLLSDAIGDEGIQGMLDYFSKALNQLEWAQFIDDTFIDPYILKGWIYQYVDWQRQVDADKRGGKNQKVYSRFFPEYLWEGNIAIYEKALEVNDESISPEKEGNLHLNIANTYFLLTNFPKALYHYQFAHKYKSRYNSRIEEAHFYYHLGYCYWQDDQIEKASQEIAKTLHIYKTLASGKTGRYRNQIYSLYRLFALFNRIDKKYKESIRWYNRILEFADLHKIEIDRARYLQEIAFCYKELGDIDKALSYLDKADRLLKGYKHSEKTHKLGLKFFGFGPFKIYDLGPDTAVVGDNKIYTELNTLNKKLLNISLREEIYIGKGNFSKAISLLKRKLILLQDRENQVDHEMKIKALNNIGYCYFRLRKYKEAGKYFKNAWDYAVDPDVNDQEGIFASIINISNLYAFLFENIPYSIDEPIKKINTLIEQISQYRFGYESNIFDIEMEGLQEIAKAQKREVTQDEIKALKERIKEEAKKKYFKIDIAIATLKYYKAEILSNSEIKISVNDRVKLAYDIYKHNRDIYNLYIEAGDIFNNAQMLSEEEQSKRLKLKLLMSLSACQEKSGFIDEAYESLTKAQNIAKNYRYTELVWKIYYRLASLINRYGMQLEGKDYIRLVNEYYYKSVKILEGFPYLKADSLNKIKNLYNDYIEHKITKGDIKAAFELSERRYKVTRSILIALTSPEFYKKRDRTYYSNFSERVKDIRRFQSSISKELEKDTSPDSELILDLESKLKDRKKALKNYIKEVKNKSPLLASYISISDNTIPNYKDIVIYKFLEIDNRVFSKRIVTGKSEFTELTDKENKDNTISDIIVKYLQQDKKASGKRRFIILNKTALEITKNESNCPAFMFLPSIERVKYYISSDNISLNSLYYTGTGLKTILSKRDELVNIAVDEGNLPNLNISKYSIIFDDRNRLEPALLFKRGIQPSLLIKDIELFDIDYMDLIIESSLYSGIKTVIFCKDMPPEPIAVILKTVINESYDKLNIASYHNARLAGIGFHGYEESKRLKNLSKIKSEQYKKYLQKLSSSDIDGAEVHLNNWRDIHIDKPEEEVKYLINLARLESLKGDYISSGRLLDKAIAESRNRFPKLNREALSSKIFQLLLLGDIAGSSSILQKNASNKDINNTLDYSVFKTIIDLNTKSKEPPAIRFKNSDLSILPLNKLKLLYAEYLYLLEYKEKAKQVLTSWKKDYPVSGRELLKVQTIIDKSIESSLASDRAGKIIKIVTKSEDLRDIDINKLKNSVLLLIENEGYYDNLSPFPVLFLLKGLIFRNRFDLALSVIKGINIDEMIKKAIWIDIVPLFNLIKVIYISEGRHQDALNIETNIAILVENRGITSVFKKILYEKGVTLSVLRRYNKSFKAANRGINLVSKDDNLYIKFQLLLIENEIYLGRIDKAQQRCEKIETGIGSKYFYILYLLKSRIHLLKIIKNRKATNAEWEHVERLIVKGLDALDRNPDILHRFSRIDLINDNIDFLISYKMSRGDNFKALQYVELKKQIGARSKMPTAFYSEKPPKKIIDEFKSIRSRKENNRFISLLKRYPMLRFNALIRMLPLGQFQKQLPKEYIALYLVRNRQDIFTWAITKDFIKAIRIKDGYSKLNEIIKKYQKYLIQLKNTARISEDIYKIFKPLERYYKNKKVILFITDHDMESVPYEIIGRKDILEESHTIIYLSSILSGFGNYHSGRKTVNLSNIQNIDLIHSLEETALKESGISYRTSDVVYEGIGHIRAPIFFNTVRSELYLGDVLFSSYLKGAEMLYIPSVDFSKHISYSNFLILNSMNNLQGAIINDAVFHDVNNAIFVDVFYKETNRGASYIKAFETAKSSIRNNIRYKHPAYWAGIRLYLNKVFHP